MFFAMIGACKPVLYPILISGVSATSPAANMFGYELSSTCSLSFTRIECVEGLYKAGESDLIISPRGIAPIAKNYPILDNSLKSNIPRGPLAGSFQT